MKGSFLAAAFLKPFMSQQNRFFWKRMVRLAEGAKSVGIRRQVTSSDVTSLVEANNLENCALKVTLTQDNVVFTARPVPYGKSHRTDGIRVAMGAGCRNERSLLAGCKSSSYAENLLERERAGRWGCSDAILLDTQGRLSEGSATNLFFVKDGEIFTPSLSCGPLPGIVRKFLMDHVPVREGAFNLEDLLNATEWCLTNSLMGIHGVRELIACDPRGGDSPNTLGTWEIGPVTRRMQAFYLKETS